MSRKMLSLVFNIPLTILILIYLILEELIWERIAEPVYKFFHSLKILQRLESSVHALNRYALLIIFLSLFVAVEALGVVSLALFSQGQVIIGVVLYAAKIPIAAFTFWLFRVAQDKLLTFTWFKYCYGALLTLLNKIKTSPIYLGIKTKTLNVKLWFKSLISSEAVRRLKRALGFKTY